MMQPLEYELPRDKPTKLMVAIPITNEEWFRRIFIKNKNWIGDSNHNSGSHIVRLVDNMEDLKYLKENILAPLYDKSQENKRGEILMTENFPPKEYGVKIWEYIDHFVKSKGVHSHYDYRISHCARIVVRVLETGDNYDVFLVPLYVRLKFGKTLDQMKVVEYNDDGSSYRLVTPPRKWFIKDYVEPKPEE
jgi:translation initiation factor 2 beta subunit (eIF-2beta)/eIF-5